MRAAVLPVVGAGMLATACGEDQRPAETRAPKAAPRSAIAHVQAFQRVADRHGGNRAAGTPGDRASVRYAVDRLRAAGYRVRTEPVRFSFFDERRRARLSGVRRLRTMVYSGSGRVRARLANADDGCQPADFDRLPRGRIALIRRGTCTFESKVRRAQRARAAGAVVFNDDEGRELISASLGTPGARIPAVFVSSEDGAALARRRNPLTLAVRAVSERRTTRNVVADSRFGRGKRVVLGGHLDSVPEGPGANDNASGVSTALAIAERQARARAPGRRPLRVALWGAEELGLHGSRQHVRRLGRQGRASIATYINLDMVGSADGGRFVYGSDQPIARALRGEAERVLERRGAEVEERSLAGGSDHAPFQRAGIPVFGLFSGAGDPYDRCYHRRCDRAGRLNRRVLDDLSRAAAAAVATALDPRKAAR